MVLIRMRRTMLTECQACGETKTTVKRRRLNTLYANDEQNHLTSCLECFVDTWDYYEDLWVATDRGYGYGPYKGD